MDLVVLLDIKSLAVEILGISRENKDAKHLAMFRLIACSMFQRFTCLMYVYTNTRTQIPLDTYKQVYHQTEIRLNYAKCYNLRGILLNCVRCCSNMSNILLN